MELCTPRLSCNFSVEVLCGRSCVDIVKSFCVRQGRRAVTRTSKHILMFVFDLLFLNFLLSLYLALLISLIHLHG